MVWHVVSAIKELLPDIFVLENVKEYAEDRRFQTQFTDTVAKLKAIGGKLYNVDWKVLDSHSFGVPARRERLYFVGVRRDRQRTSWQWPEPQHPVRLATILDPMTPGTMPASLSNLSPTARRNIDRAVDAIVAKQPDVDPTSQPWVIDICNSPSFGANLALDRFPTITKARGKYLGYFLLHQLRCVSEDEFLRAQGLRPADIKLPKHIAMPKNVRAEMSGNAFTVTVFQALFKELLPAIGITV